MAPPDTIPRHSLIVIALLAIAISILLVGLVLADVETPMRGVLGLLFIAFVPGSALLTFRENWQFGEYATLALLLSVTVCVAVGYAMAETGIWSPGAALSVVALGSIALHGRSLLRTLEPEPSTTAERSHD